MEPERAHDNGVSENLMAEKSSKIKGPMLRVCARLLKPKNRAARTGQAGQLAPKCRPENSAIVSQTELLLAARSRVSPLLMHHERGTEALSREPHTWSAKTSAVVTEERRSGSAQDQRA